MGIFKDDMYTEEEVTQIKKVYQDVGWLIRDFEALPMNRRGSWVCEYPLHYFKDYEFKIIARELTKYFQNYGYKVMHRKTENFDELYTTEV